MESPVAGVVVNVPAVDLSDELGNASQHITARSDGGFNLQKNTAAQMLCCGVHGKWGC